MIESVLLQPGEEIVPIRGYEKLYSITSFGRVWSHTKKRGFIRQRGKFLKYSVDKDGYFYLILSIENKKTLCKPHRLIAQAFIPNPNNLPEVNHKDGDKQNNFAGTKEKNYEDGNLEWCTSQDNKNHAVENGLVYKIHSRYRGVTFYVGDMHSKKPWGAQVKVNKKQKYIGCYKTEIEAAYAYNKYVVEHKLNRPLNEIIKEDDESFEG